MQLEKLEKSFTVYRSLLRPFIPIINHINLLTYYFIMNMVWLVIVCMCQCTSHYWVTIHVRHQHYGVPLGCKAEIYSGRQYLSDGPIFY